MEKDTEKVRGLVVNDKRTGRILVKSERLRKLESELRDLESWLKLGLVPKKDLVKHKEEIASITEKIDEEVKRLEQLRQSGEVDETAIPSRKAGARSYADTPTLHGLGMTDDVGMTESGFDFDTEAMDTDAETDDDADETEDDTESETEADVDSEAEEDEDDMTEDPFSDTNRWRRGIRDPDADEW